MSRFSPVMISSLFVIAVVFNSRAQIKDRVSEKQELEKQDQQVRIAVLFSLIPVVVAFSFIVFVFYRAKRESHFKQKEAEFKLNISELEMKALRAQINPHFIFNCLNSIHHYMHHHEALQAGEYLIKFSQLIRYVLETSSSRMVPLDDDLDALKAYVELEQLRLQSSFEFEVDKHDMDALQGIHIPPMMMQPFVENSIWHGLSGKGNGGHIKLSVSRKNDLMQCVIEDNGNRKHENAGTRLNSQIKKTSMGMSLIKDRLAVVSKIYHVNADFKMEDCLNDPIPTEGTRITLVLPFEE